MNDGLGRPSRLGRLSRLELPGRWLGLVLLFAYAAVVAVHLASGLAMEAWDDSYFFKRIGLNILETGTAAWNVEDGPVYGNTSQGFQLVALIPLLLRSDHYIASVKLLSALSMVLLFATYLAAARRAAADGSPSDLAASGGTGLLAASAPFLLLLIHSGMETCLALAALAINLVVIHGAANDRRGTAAVVGTTALVYLMRPDAVAISLVTIALYGWARDRKLPWRLLLCTLAALAALLAIFYLYFGTPFPLAFYLKSRALTVYSADFVAMDFALKKRNLFGVLVLAAPLFYVAAHRLNAWTAALLASSLVFIAYHYLSTVEVMGSYARFYVPALVPAALAAIAAAPELRRRWHPLVSLAFSAAYLAAVVALYRKGIIYNQKDRWIMQVADDLYLGYAIGAAILVVGARVRAGAAAVLVALAVLVGGARGRPALSFRLESDETLVMRHIERPTTVRGIRAVRACIEQPFHMYHTEIGAPGILFQSSTITDMAGLMDREIALRGMDFDARCHRDRPELIFLPHRNYKSLRDQIAAGTCIRDYTRVVRESSSPLYIRNDLLPPFLACARRIGDRWIDPR